MCVHIKAKWFLDLVVLTQLACRQLSFAGTQLLAGWNVFSSEESAVLGSVVRCMSNTTDKALYDEPLERKHGDTVIQWNDTGRQRS